ncbi:MULTISPECIES: VOC family protein [Tsukamurella]|uniref:VOC family protein n=1 Tax=Tsukamurella strandjordii TaxID=147577 RepID=A0AA90N8M1_9ACTN|nr:MULTISPECIES: VOC family protein [Tsukamurella]MDP0397727.1 VOC family protein [Tsukamurella strandjordii]GIZ99168.1 chaP protein [Tsukamurella sp. TY48]
MPARFNHTIIFAADSAQSATFYRDYLEARSVDSWGVFTNLEIEDGVLLQIAAPPIEIQPQHYAFLVDDDHFDRAYALLTDRGVDHAADPFWQRPGEINHEHGGRGVYVRDPAGHGIELLTRPYL